MVNLCMSGSRVNREQKLPESIGNPWKRQIKKQAGERERLCFCRSSTFHSYFCSSCSPLTNSGVLGDRERDDVKECIPLQSFTLSPPESESTTVVWTGVRSVFLPCFIVVLMNSGIVMLSLWLPSSSFYLLYFILASSLDSWCYWSMQMFGSYCFSTALFRWDNRDTFSFTTLLQRLLTLCQLFLLK